MHELSIIHSVIEAAAGELAIRGNRHSIEGITLKIGRLAGVETDTIEFLWSAAVDNTLLQGALMQIEHVEALARCTGCNHQFTVSHFYEPCPKCNSHFLDILQGEELQIGSLTLVEMDEVSMHENKLLN